MLSGLEARPRRRAVAQTSLGSCVRITGITGIRYFEKVSKMSRRHGPHSVSRDGKIPDLPDSGDSVGNDWVEVKSRAGPNLAHTSPGSRVRITRNHPGSLHTSLRGDGEYLSLMSREYPCRGEWPARWK